MVADLAKTIGNYRGRQDIALGEAFDPSPENIDAHTKIETLPSGLKAALLEKKTRGHEIHMRLTLRYGDVKNLNGKLTACQILPALDDPRDQEPVAPADPGRARQAAGDTARGRLGRAKRPFRS